jgi:type IV pilus assembly protein PilB
LGVYEVLEITPAIQAVLTSDITAEALNEKAKQDQNMVSIVEDGFIKLVEGITSLEEIMRVARD